MKRLVSILIFFSIVTSIAAQHNQVNEVNIEQFIEEILSAQGDVENLDEIYEALLLYYSDPIDLNSVSAEELRSLFILSEGQLDHFLAYRNRFGNLLSIYELQAIPEFDLNTIAKLRPFVWVSNTSSEKDPRPFIKRLLEEENNYLLIRYERTIEKARGFSPINEGDSNRYLGSANKYYVRFRTSHSKDFSMGFTAEKDAGEVLEWQPKKAQYGLDFYSGHIQLINRGRIKNIIIGDYQLQVGQGLVLGSGFNVGKGAETITTVRRANLGIRPYTSVLETGFFRGAATSIQLSDKFSITACYSQLRQDASVRISEDSTEFISAIQASGYHRTATELANKDQLNEQNIGGSIDYRSQKPGLAIGSAWLSTRFSQPIIRNDQLYNQFEFNGTTNAIGSVYYSYNRGNVNFFGEAAMSSSKGSGIISGLIISLTRHLESSVLYRNYTRNFHTLYGRAFSESTRNINESGLYWGLKYSPAKQYTIAAYIDSYSFPWLKADISTPSTGHDYLLRATYQPTRTTLLYFQYRQRVKGDNPSKADLPTQIIRKPLDGTKINMILNLDYQSTDKLSFKSRVQWSRYQHLRTTRGYALIQDIHYDHGKIRLSARFAIFETDDFKNAQYVYERDLLYAFAIPAYNGRGIRTYLLLNYKVSRKLAFWVKYARTNYKDRSTISSGLNEIEGSKRTDIRLQCRVKF